jgi:soluble lytic murein transglycosylase-like protein
MYAELLQKLGELTILLTLLQIQNAEAQMPPIQVMIHQKAVAANLDADMVLFVALKESNFEPLAKNPSSSATGLFQIIKSTWKAFECTGERTDPEDNTDCAVKILGSPNGLEHWRADKSMRVQIDRFLNQAL